MPSYVRHCTTKLVVRTVQPCFSALTPNAAPHSQLSQAAVWPQPWAKPSLRNCCAGSAVRLSRAALLGAMQFQIGRATHGNGQGVFKYPLPQCTTSNPCISPRHTRAWPRTHQMHSSWTQPKPTQQHEQHKMTGPSALESISKKNVD